GFDIEEERAARMRERVATALRDTTDAVELLWSTPSVMGRFEETGTLARSDAEELGLVGPVARSCGLTRDVRSDFPTGIYRFAQIAGAHVDSGDVFGRAYLRWIEIQRSPAFVSEELDKLPAGPLRKPLGPLAPDSLCVSLVEGWRGEICHVVRTDDAGAI